MRSSKTAYWANDIRTRLTFERGAKAAFPDLRCTATGRRLGGHVVYTVTVDVPHYAVRRITMVIGNATTPYLVEVTADGPTESPHRYDVRRLCLWHPSSPSGSGGSARTDCSR